eukprot:61553-Rhodomonas_salina.1
MCQLQGVQFTATYVSDSELQCTVPVQTWDFGEVALTVFENSQSLYMPGTLTFTFGALAISVSQDFGNRLGGVGTTNTYASDILVTGAGFFATFSYACRFTLVSPKTQLARAVVSNAKRQEHLGIMREILDTVNEANCPCPGGCKTFQYGSITDGFRRYPRETSCYWFLSPAQASSLAVSFTEFNTELNFDLVSVWSCDDAQNCTNPVLLNLLSGSGPSERSHVVSPTGVVLITFRSDRLIDGQGFTARFEPAAAQSTFSRPSSNEQFACVLPVWDRSTPWKLYSATTTELRVLSSEDGGLTSSVVLPSSANANDVLSNFTFFQINQPPSFEGTNVHVVASVQDNPLSIIAWAGNVLVGTDDFNLPIQAEFDQELTFTVTVLQGQDLFRSLPSISVDGTLSFTIAAEEYGVAILFTTLTDDGDTSFGGLNSLSKTFQVEIFTEPPFQDTPQLTSIMQIEVAEGSGPHRIVDAVSDIAPGVIDNLIKTVDVSVASGLTYLSTAPYLDRGTLFFELQPFVFGNASITVTLLARDPNNNATSNYTAKIQLRILPVNDQPAFQLASSTIFVDESKNETAWFSFSEFAVNIATGPIISVGPSGEDWPELLQTVTFTIVGTGRPFETQPTVSSNGTLSFVLTADVSGSVSFELRMQDSGGDALGGIDMSSPLTFTVVVRQINDSPSFGINCRPALANAQSYSCGSESECARSGVGCKVSINVDENCVNCEQSALASCAYGFVVENFATNILNSVIESPDEASQALMFTFTASNDSRALLERLPTIDPDTGTLVLCLKESANGNATFEVSLVDDGGVYGGGVDSTGTAEIALQISSVNQQPSLEICSDCSGACCDQ